MSWLGLKPTLRLAATVVPLTIYLNIYNKLILLFPISSGVAVALKQTMNPEFKQYAANVIQNAQVMCKKLVELGYKIVTGTYYSLLF